MDGQIIFDKIEEDEILEKMTKTSIKSQAGLQFLKNSQNVPLTPELMSEFSRRVEYLRFKST